MLDSVDNRVTYSNGDLLDAAEKQFDVIVTTDQNLRRQQNPTKRRLEVFVPPVASWPKLQPHAMALASAIDALRPGDYVEFVVP